MVNGICRRGGLLLAALICCLAGTAQAASVPGQGVWATSLHARDLDGRPVALDSAAAVFLYDDVLDVTWLRDAAASGPQSSWYAANQWAADLVVGRYDDWRLPRVQYPSGLPGDTICLECTIVGSGFTFGYNSPTKSGDVAQYEAGQTVYSEMAHLFYVTLGNLAPKDLNYQPQTFWGLTNSGPFQNLLTDALVADPYFGGTQRVVFRYWAENGLDGRFRDRYAWEFAFWDGLQGLQLRLGSGGYGLAVRDGDVFGAAPVPVPGALPLLAGALAGLASRRRR